MRDRNYKALKDNKGSALMLVMISVAFIGILAVVLLGVSYTNLRLKTLDGRSRANYYTAETAIAEIEGALEEYSADSMKGAYEAQLEHYIEYSSAQRNAYLKTYYFTSMQNKLKHPSEAGKYDASKLKSFTTKDGVTIVDYSADTSSKGALVYNEEAASLTLKNVRVEYDANGLRSSITTDIVIGLPKPKEEAVGYLDYALISDELIDINTNVTVDVKGGVYAGDKRNGSRSGIVVGSETSTGDPSTLRINGAGTDLISRSNVKVNNKASLDIMNGTLWTKDIVLGSSTAYKLSQKTGADLILEGDDSEFNVGPKISVDGTTNVKGDLCLNARYSAAVFKNAYFGYSFGGAESASSNSAIVINGYGSSLDMSDVNVLFIAGRSFVSGEGVGGDSGGSSAASDILEGESIATKKNETMYLVNSKYLIKSIGSNPASADNVEAVTTALPGSKEYADAIIKMQEVVGAPGTYEYVSGFKTIYDQFLDPNEPIKCYYSPSPRVVYFYLNFENEQKAQQYVTYYYNLNNSNKEMFDSNLKIFLKNNEIKINASGARYNVVGSVIANFNNTAGISSRPGDTTLSADEFRQEIADMDDEYGSLQTYLRKYRGYDEDRFNRGYVASVVNVPNIKAVNAGKPSKVTTLQGPDNTVIYLVDNDDSGDEPFIVNNTTKHGIVVATGDVKLEGVPRTNPYKGLILAVGKIYSNGGAAEDYFEADSDLLLKLFEHIGKDEIEKYFNEYPGQSSMTVSYSDYIEYENWQKDADR